MSNGADKALSKGVKVILSPYFYPILEHEKASTAKMVGKLRLKTSTR